MNLWGKVQSLFLVNSKPDDGTNSMSETSTFYMQRRQIFHLKWLPVIVGKPSSVFERIKQQPNSWFTPLLIISIAILMNVFANGYLKHQAAINGNIPTPPDFQYWSPEQQTQYFQSQQVRQGPVFLYVIPSIASIASTWIRWILISGILHLVLTLLGGRGETNANSAIVAWSSIPLGIRAVVRTVYLITSHQFITSPGLSGFAPIGISTSQVILSNFLSLVDIYVIWHILLLILGVKICTGIKTSKSVFGVLIVIGFILLLQTLAGYLIYQISDITVIRPFFF